ncbi:MAG: helix-turn-helix domain-containing protein [Deltaproteobacteria bacterium]|nr:helix-turn-helix domain-containing protein [Deltaproteobacteria bacterium]
MEFNMNDVMNVDEVAKWLRIPKSTLYKLCSEGQIPCTKIGKH